MFYDYNVCFSSIDLKVPCDVSDTNVQFFVYNFASW